MTYRTPEGQAEEQIRIAAERLAVENARHAVEEQRLAIENQRLPIEQGRHGFEKQRLDAENVRLILERRRSKQGGCAIWISGVAVLISLASLGVAMWRTIPVNVKSLPDITIVNRSETKNNRNSHDSHYSQHCENKKDIKYGTTESIEVPLLPETETSPPCTVPY